MYQYVLHFTYSLSVILLYILRLWGNLYFQKGHLPNPTPIAKLLFRGDNYLFIIFFLFFFLFLYTFFGSWSKSKIARIGAFYNCKYYYFYPKKRGSKDERGEVVFPSFFFRGGVIPFRNRSFLDLCESLQSEIGSRLFAFFVPNRKIVVFCTPQIRNPVLFGTKSDLFGCLLCGWRRELLRPSRSSPSHPLIVSPSPSCSFLLHSCIFFSTSNNEVSTQVLHSRQQVAPGFDVR
jgi:hypothetical protein